MRSDILIFNFGCLSSGHVSKVIRGYFSKTEGVREQNLYGNPELGEIFYTISNPNVIYKCFIFRLKKRSMEN
jgi:hypothetical protein